MTDDMPPAKRRHAWRLHDMARAHGHCGAVTGITDSGAGLYDLRACHLHSGHVGPHAARWMGDLTTWYGAADLSGVAVRPLDLTALRTAASPTEPDPETSGALLRRLGVDGALWAQEFAKAFGGDPAPGGTLHGWVVNMIEAGRSAGYSEYRREAHERRERAYLFDPIVHAVETVAANLTREVLRPTLAQAGVKDPERYHLAPDYTRLHPLRQPYDNPAGRWRTPVPNDLPHPDDPGPADPGRAGWIEPSPLQPDDASIEVQVTTDVSSTNAGVDERHVAPAAPDTSSPPAAATPAPSPLCGALSILWPDDEQVDVECSLLAGHLGDHSEGAVTWSRDTDGPQCPDQHPHPVVAWALLQLSTYSGNPWIDPAQIRELRDLVDQPSSWLVLIRRQARGSFGDPVDYLARELRRWLDSDEGREQLALPGAKALDRAWMATSYPAMPGSVLVGRHLHDARHHGGLIARAYPVHPALVSGVDGLRNFIEGTTGVTVLVTPAFLDDVVGAAHWQDDDRLGALLAASRVSGVYACFPPVD